MRYSKNRLRQYWDLYVEKWEADSYEPFRGGIIKKINFNLRRPLRRRAEAALSLLKPYLPSAKILELGCGTGRFSAELLQHGAKEVTGADISSVAIQQADKRLRKINIDKSKYRFFCRNALDIDYSNFDIVVGLGFLDWLELEEIRELFNRIKGKLFLLSFSEKRWDWYSIIHRVYWLLRIIAVKIKVKPYYYAVKQIKKIYGPGQIKFIKDKDTALSIIMHNLPLEDGQ